MKVQYIMGVDPYKEQEEGSVPVKEILRISDLMYIVELNGELSHKRVLTPKEALEKFGAHMSQETKNKISK
tara:strand:+ start:19982 stop:20194 length:213 start_codon:yes stop_codon:yes gene_type:complete